MAIRPSIQFLATVALSAMLSGCGDDAPSPTAPRVVGGSARVTALHLSILDSFPVQVHANVSLQLADACTRLGRVTQSRNGNRISVRISTERPANAQCALIIVEIDEVVPLEVVGLPAGEYTVDVNGVTETFTLTIDNELPQ